MCIEETISFQMMIMILLVVPFGSVSILAVKRFDGTRVTFVSVSVYILAHFFATMCNKETKKNTSRFLAVTS